MYQSLWQRCLSVLEQELSQQNFDLWIRPLQIHTIKGHVTLYAPNRFVLQWVEDNHLPRVIELFSQLSTAGEAVPDISCEIGSVPSAPASVSNIAQKDKPTLEDSTQTSFTTNNHNLNTTVESNQIINKSANDPVSSLANRRNSLGRKGINPNYTFDSFVEGNSNQLARAAAMQVADNPGDSYNPLFLYGTPGLGKTHLLHAIANQILDINPKAKVEYLQSERFVQDMVKALHNNSIEKFKQYYRSLDALLIDDIQIFAKKERTQEEFFHTFNALLEGNKQIILTCDRYPKEIEGVDERLKSRFAWGLNVPIEPPELETRVAILIKKASQSDIELPNEVAFFIAKRMRTNVRGLEGALNRVIASANFSGARITIDFVKDALQDLLALHDKLVTIDNIQTTVAEYFKIRLSDLKSKSRSRSVTRPRQVAMYLAKDLTTHSLPEIGQSFGGRDHTTVLHACKKVKQLISEDQQIKEDVNNLVRTLSS